MADGHEPAFPGWSARIESTVERMVVAYFGVQVRGAQAKDRALAALGGVQRLLGASHGPTHRDIAHHVDAQGDDNFVVVSYWLDASQFALWQAGSGYLAWWNDDERLQEELGYFHEILTPSPAGFETLISDPQTLAGASAALGATTAAPIQEHGYWGGMRDRIARAQTERLSASGSPMLAQSSDDGARKKVIGPDNLAMIRSGQDWSATAGDEREMYLRKVEPALRRGMAFLSNSGPEVGCYSNAYMRIIDPNGDPRDATFGFSLWRSLGDLEGWSEHHPSHMAILGSFMNLIAKMDNKIDVRLYHEVCVLRTDEQIYEYINCHAQTGMLKYLAA